MKRRSGIGGHPARARVKRIDRKGNVLFPHIGDLLALAAKYVL